MGIPIAELQERISSREFAEYYVMSLREPWGPTRDDLRAGIIAATVANANRDPKKRPRPFTPDQFTGAVLQDPQEEPELEEPVTDEKLPAIEAAADVAGDGELEADPVEARIDALFAELASDQADQPIVRRRE